MNTDIFLERYTDYFVPTEDEAERELMGLLQEGFKAKVYEVGMMGWTLVLDNEEPGT
jgi:hypothetical protein